jgi:hypothetical protein
MILLIPSRATPSELSRSADSKENVLYLYLNASVSERAVILVENIPFC